MKTFREELFDYKYSSIIVVKTTFTNGDINIYFRFHPIMNAIWSPDYFYYLDMFLNNINIENRKIGYENRTKRY